MMFKNTLCQMIYNAFYFIILFQQLYASSLNGTENIEAALNGIINDAERFDKSIDDLEYTVMHLEDSIAELQNVGNNPFVFFNDNKSDDVITVIEIKCNSKDEANLKDQMPEIVNCLKKYVSNDDEKEHFNEHAAIRVDTIRNEDLYRYELLYGSTSMYKQFRDIIQDDFIYRINRKIESRLYVYLNDCIHETVKLYINTMNSEEITDEDYGHLKCIFLSDIFIKSFFPHCLVNVTEDILKNMTKGFEQGVIVYLKNRILHYKSLYAMDYLDSENLIDEIRKIYINGFRDLVHDNMISAIEKMVNVIKDMPIEHIKKICIKHVTSALRDKNSNNDSSNAPENSIINDLLKALASSGMQVIQFDEGVANIGGLFKECLREFREVIDDSIIFGITSKGFDKCLKIVCSEKITEENLPLLCYILNNTTLNLKNDAKQVLYINMRQNVDLGIISKQIRSLFEYRDDGSIIYGTKNENNKFERINIVSKKQGERKLSVSNIGIDTLINAVGTKENQNKEAAAIDIQNLIQQKIHTIDVADNKRISITGRCIENNDCLSIYYKNSCSEFENIIKIDVRDVVSTDDVQVVIYKKMIRIEGANLCSNPLDSDCLNSHDGYNLIKSVTLNARYIAPKLIQYLENIHLLPQGMEHTPLFDFGESQRYQVNDFTLCATIIAPEIPSTEVTSTLNDIEQKIESFYGSNMNTDKTIKIETSLFDFLRRNHTRVWEELTKEFFLNSRINQKELENAIYKHLVDRYHINANSDYAIPSIISRDHKVVIIAVIRKNSNTILHLVRKDLDPITSNLPLAKLLDFFMVEINETLVSEAGHCSDHTKQANRIGINTTAYVIQTMAALKFNMAGDFVEQFKRRKDMFIDQFYGFVSPYMQKDMVKEEKQLCECNEISENKNPDNDHPKNIFDQEIEIILERLEQKIKNIEFNSSIRVTVFSLNSPESSDMKDVDEIIKLVRHD